MSVALKLYEQLTDAADDRERFRLIADAIGTLEDAWPRPGEVVRAGDVREAELVRLETERVRGEIRASETRLQQSLHRQTFWIIGAVGAVVGLIRLLDAVLP